MPFFTGKLLVTSKTFTVCNEEAIVSQGDEKAIFTCTNDVTGQPIGYVFSVSANDTVVNVRDDRVPGALSGQFYACLSFLENGKYNLFFFNKYVIC